MKNRISQIVNIMTPEEFVEHNKLEVYRRFAEAIEMMIKRGSSQQRQ